MSYIYTDFQSSISHKTSNCTTHDALTASIRLSASALHSATWRSFATILRAMAWY